MQDNDKPRNEDTTMKKTYTRPQVDVKEIELETLMAASPAFDIADNGNNGEKGGIGTAGDGDSFTMESKSTDFWED